MNAMGDIWSAGIVSSGIKLDYYDGLKILNQNSLPIMEKEHFRTISNKVEQSFNGNNQLIIEKTSGSTGVPLTICRTKAEQIRMGFILNQYRKRFCENVSFTRFLDVSAEKLPIIRRPFSEIERVTLSAKYSSEDMLLKYIDVIEEFDPTFIQGFPSFLVLLSTFSAKINRPLKLPSLGFIETRSESLSQEQRQIIENAFQTTVAGHYGSKEVWTIAYSCKFGLLHLVSESCHVEVVDNNNKSLPVGEFGDIVVTSMILKTMPFIRYRLGDKGRLLSEICECGSKDLIIEIDGRSSDYLVTRNGLISRMALSQVWIYIRNNPNVDQAQVEQVAIDVFEVRVLGHSINTKKVEDDLSCLLSQAVGSEVAVYVRIGSIKIEQSGKQRAFIPLKSY